MKLAALYARTSTERQKDEATIESQIAEVESQIRLDGNVLLANGKYLDDGWSGDLLARPGLDQMRDAARRHEFAILYVYDRGRLARKFAYQELVLEELSDLAIEFATLHDAKADTPEEKVLQSMQGVFAEYEKVKIAERMRRGKQFKTRSGNLLGYNPLFGYNYIHKLGTENGYFLINEVEAEIVKKIFNYIGNEGYSILGTIKKLYEEKVYPPKNKREFWVKSTIERMVKNESYTGNHHYYKTQSAVPKNPKALKPGEYKRIKKSSRIDRPKSDWIPIQIPQIISRELFDKVQARLKLNSKFAARNGKGNYLLSGLVYCTCGMKRVGEKSADHLYYRCSDRIYSYPMPPKCHEKGINAGMFDALVYDKVIELLKDRAIVQHEIRRWLGSTKSDQSVTQGQIAKVQEQLDKLGKEEQRYLKAFGSGLSSFEVYEKQMNELNNSKVRLQNELNKLESGTDQQNQKPKVTMASVYKKAVDGVKLLETESKQNFVRKVITQIVANQTTAIVKGYLPFIIEENEEENVLFKTEDSYLGNSTSHNIEIGDKNVGFKLKDRYCRAAKCG